MITAMLFAGGSGVRMQSSDLPKQFLEVGGKPIIIHTMEHFSNHPWVDGIVVACKEDWIDYLIKLIEQFKACGHPVHTTGLAVAEDPVLAGTDS